MSDKIGLFTGSFDPMTKGHVDLIERASRLFDKLYVGFSITEKSLVFSQLKLESAWSKKLCSIWIMSR